MTFAQNPVQEDGEREGYGVEESQEEENQPRGLLGEGGRRGCKKKVKQK